MCTNEVVLKEIVLRYCLAMDKNWMDKKRGTRKYFESVKRFVEFVSFNAHDRKISCPCCKCVHSELLPAEVVQNVSFYVQIFKSSAWYFVMIVI